MGEFIYYLGWEWINLCLEEVAVMWWRVPRRFWAVVSVNLLTHPAFNLFVHRCEPTQLRLLVAELLVFVVEAVALAAIYRWRWRECAVASLVMNLTSYATGLAIYW